MIKRKWNLKFKKEKRAEIIKNLIVQLFVFKRERNMKKFLRSFLIIVILLFTGCGRVTEQQARQTLSLYLQERYGEEFDIGFGGRRGYTVGDRKVSWYEYEITPQSYKGMNKLYDKYYDCIGTVILEKNFIGERIKTSADTYGSVLLKEQANEFYGKKLKELFGENVLPILEITGSYSVKNKSFLENVELTKKREKENNGISLYIEGGIYIFGRVENDEDREKYREEIYKFLSFMKETGTFEYVSLNFKVIDERVLSDEYYKNDNLRNEILSYGKKVAIKDREKLFQKLTESFSKTSQKDKLKRMENLNKTNMLENTIGYTGSPSLLYTKVRSKKYIESNSLTEIKIKDYNEISDVEFTIEQIMN